jgi:chromatin remodeling complex protein RSC6
MTKKKVKPVETKQSALDVQEGGGHYKSMKIQPVEYITANNLSFTEGSIIKYVSRHKSKNGVEDLKKARHFIDLLIELEYTKPAAEKARLEAEAKKLKPKKKLRRPSAMFTLLKTSASLKEIVGAESITRTDAVKKVWDYIKKNNLNAQDKRNIKLDDKMKKVFGDREKISMFEMPRKISDHLKAY